MLLLSTAVSKADYPKHLDGFMKIRERSTASLPRDDGRSATKVGEVFVERPTLNCLGFRWPIEGDDNRNAKVAVRYRIKGEGSWREAMPLLRLKNEVVGTRRLEWRTPNAFAGSIVDLEPGTDYEVELTLTDRDGGDAKKLLVCRTREPFQVSVASAQPVKGDLQKAYEQAEPNAALLLSAGVHRGTLKFDEDKPITIIGLDGAILDGNGDDVLLDATGSRGVRLVNLTLRNAGTMVRNGSELTLYNCVIDKPSVFGVYVNDPKARDFLIENCRFIGPLKYDWSDYSNKGKGVEPHGVELRGSGHVIAFNRFEHWWDAIRLAGGVPPEDPKRHNAAIDILNNEMSHCNGDGIELDYGVHNLRVMRNFVWHCYGGISTQPLYGGPAYVARNVLFNVKRYALKLNQAPAGVLVYHNTILMGGPRANSGMEWANVHFRNNLILGRDVDEGLIWTGTPLPETCSFDHNGWREMKNNRFFWRFAHERRSSGGSMSYEDVFPTLAAWAKATGYEQHGITVDYDVFVSGVMPTGADGPLPTMDLRLRDDSSAIDKGEVLPNFNDGYAGSAPDPGAIELGSAPARTGPR